MSGQDDFMTPGYQPRWSRTDTAIVSGSALIALGLIAAAVAIVIRGLL